MGNIAPLGSNPPEDSGFLSSVSERIQKVTNFVLSTLYKYPVPLGVGLFATASAGYIAYRAVQSLQDYKNYLSVNAIIDQLQLDTSLDQLIEKCRTMREENRTILEVRSEVWNWVNTQVSSYEIDYNDKKILVTTLYNQIMNASSKEVMKNTCTSYLRFLIAKDGLVRRGPRGLNDILNQYKTLVELTRGADVEAADKRKEQFAVSLNIFFKTYNRYFKLSDSLDEDMKRTEMGHQLIERSLQVVSFDAGQLMNTIKTRLVEIELQIQQSESIYAACALIVELHDGLLIREHLTAQTEKHWEGLNAPRSCNNQHNKEVLLNKIASILLEHKTQSTELKLTIIKNVIHNFVNTINEFERRFNEDKNNIEFLRMFDLKPNDQISEIEITAEETHKQGKVPLIITITIIVEREGKQTKIVYKPRSMHAEKLICAEGDSLFAQLQLPTYKVFIRDDYGYCEFLENRSEENQFSTKEEITDYIRIFFKIEAVAREIGLSDLHNLNVITSKKKPQLTDVEVVLVPTNVPADKPQYDSHLLDGGQQGLLYDENSVEKSKHKNKIALSGDLSKTYHYGSNALNVIKFEMLISTGATNPKDSLNSIIQNDLEIQTMLNTHRHQIEACKEQLKAYRHRFVLISTDDLGNVIKSNLEEGMNAFLDKMSNALGRWTATNLLDDGITRNQVREQFKQDVENNDVPIIYYDARSKTLHYGEACIARFE